MRPLGPASHQEKYKLYQKRLEKQEQKILTYLCPLLVVLLHPIDCCLITHCSYEHPSWTRHLVHGLVWCGRVLGHDLVRRGRNLCHVHVCRHESTTIICQRRSLGQGLVCYVRGLGEDASTWHQLWQ